MAILIMFRVTKYTPDSGITWKMLTSDVSSFPEVKLVEHKFNSIPSLRAVGFAHSALADQLYT